MTQGRTGTAARGKGRTAGGRHHKRNSKRNQMVILRWIVVAAALIAVILMIIRCAGGGKSSDAFVSIDETVSRVQFSKKGALTVTSVESFDKDYYSENELQEAVDSAVSSYGSGVSAGGLTVTDGVATLVMKYDSAEDYAAFNDQEMFWGTLQAAEDAGYDLSGFSGQTNAQDKNETYGEGTARTLADNTVVVITEPLDVITAVNILYASSNLTIKDDGYATVTGDVSVSEPAILILQ